VRYLVFILFLTGIANGQTPGRQVVVGYSLEMVVPGAIAGLARPPSFATVQVDDGRVRITGKAPGTADIVLVTASTTIHLPVMVLPLPVPVIAEAKPRVVPSRPPISSPFALPQKKVEVKKIAWLPIPLFNPPKPIGNLVPVSTQTDIASELSAPPKNADLADNLSAPNENAGQTASRVNETEVPQQIPTAVLANTWNSAGTPELMVQAGHSLRVVAPGVTAAYVLDGLYAEVILDAGYVLITGKFAGHTQIMLVGESGVQNLSVEVTAAPPNYPPGFILPDSSEQGREYGIYEIRYLSDQQQIQNLLDFTVQDPQRTTQFHMLTSNLFDAPSGGTRMILASAFYRIKTPGWDITLLDKQTRISPLTVDNTLLRGVHVETGRWLVHAGYSSLATFHGFLFPIRPEAVAGASYVLPLSTNSELTSSVYNFFSAGQAFGTGRPGVVGSMMYTYHPRHGVEFLGELAVGHGLASAARLRLSTLKDELNASFRQKPRTFPSLSIDNIPGIQAQLAWARKLSSTLSNNLNFSENRLLLPQGRQNNLILTEGIQVRASRRWSGGSGITFAGFNQTGIAGAYSLQSVYLTQHVNYDLPHFGTGFQYQYSHNSQGYAAGQDFRQNFRASRGGLSVSAYAQHQTQAIAVESIFSQIPGLQPELDRLGLGASTPEQVQALLQDSTFLLGLGLSPGSRLNLVPSRIQAGGNLNYVSRSVRPQQMNLGFIYNHDKSLLGISNNWDLTSTYSRQFSRTYSISFSMALLHVQQRGQSEYYPQVQFVLRHSFSTLPSFLSTHKYGTVSGNVFEDEEGQGKFRKSAPPLAGVEVVLDGAKRTLTDEKGYYSFRHVPKSGHIIEVHFQSNKPFWFTGPSKTVASINVETNLGVRFAAAELIGYLKNDAGEGVQGAQIAVWGVSQKLNVQSDGDGRFAVPGLGAGEYTVAIDPNSLPPGYFLEDLKSEKVELQNGAPKTLEISVRALRSLSGLVTEYSATLGKYIPVPGMVVELAKLSRKTVTNSSGGFVFHDLPAGSFNLTVSGDEAGESRQVTLPSEPTNIKEDIKLAGQQNSRKSK
jgi:hypothetical protein